MDNNYPNSLNNIQTDTLGDNSGLTLRDILVIVLDHWKWFVLSAVVCLLAGILYVLHYTPVYSRSASILIKEDMKSSSALDVTSSFSDLGFGVSRVNVNNELVNFQSPDLMMSVVRNLDLDVSYSSKGTFHSIPRYGNNLPIKVRFLSVEFNEPASLTVTPSDSSHVILSHFTKDKLKDEETTLIVAYGDTTDTPAGRIVVERAFTFAQQEFTDPIYVNRVGYRAATNRCMSSLTASLSGKNTTVIELTYKDVIIQRADDILWMVINVYNENWIKDKNIISTSANEFINERLSIIEQELGSVDQTIVSFRSSHRLPDNNAVSQDMQLSTEAGKLLIDLNNQLSIAHILRSDVLGASAGALLPANVGLSDANTQSLITQFNTDMLQRNRLAENSSEDNLLVKDLDGQMASLRQAILTSLDNYIKSLNIQIRSTEQVQHDFDARVIAVPRQAGEILSDERQQKVKEALYIFLLQKREENELSQAFTAYTTRLIASPGGSSSPVAPNKKMILLAALILGLAMPFGFLYLREVLNTTVRGRKDMENLSVPFLGEIPSISAKKHFHERALAWIRTVAGKSTYEEKKREIVVKEHSRNVVNEAFRVVRTNLEFMRSTDNGSQVIMVTSFNVNSGKTFISTNLPAALAVKNRRVLVIDLDLRKLTLSLLVDKPKKGVADYLSGKTDDFESLIVHDVEGSSLDIMPVGMMPPNPAELLAEPRLGKMLGALRSHYDYIFLDCPPIGIVTDPDVVAPLADSCILVVMAGLTERTMLPQLDHYYTSKRYNNISVVLNGTERIGHYGYKYGYGYGKYGYGYSYGYGYHTYGLSEEEA
jgi:capsular exopolysaccharide synthesis family protein